MNTQYELSVEKLPNNEIGNFLTLEELLLKLQSEDMPKEEILSSLRMLQNNSEEIDEEYIIEKLREESYEAKCAIDSSGDTNNSCKWYDHQAEMKKFSKKFPNYLFSLKGIGEEPGKMFMTYFLNGKMQHEPAKIIFDKFDFNKLN